MPVSGWLSNTFGRKRFFLVCIAGFTIPSLLCGLAPNLASLIVLRAVQGAAGGGLQPSGQAILADGFPPEKRGMASAIYGIAPVVAPTVGPTSGAATGIAPHEEKIMLVQWRKLDLDQHLARTWRARLGDLCDT
jgi:MFS family permease